MKAKIKARHFMYFPNFISLISPTNQKIFFKRLPDFVTVAGKKIGIYLDWVIVHHCSILGRRLRTA
jgi:hypothetical protein